MSRLNKELSKLNMKKNTIPSENGSRHEKNTHHKEEIDNKYSKIKDV